MGTDKEKSDKSIADINARIDKLKTSIVVPLDGDFVSILLQGKSPQYFKRFAAWARDTLDRESHMENLVRAKLSSFALDLLTKRSELGDEYIAGKAAAILELYEDMVRLSNPNEFKKDN